MLEGGGVWIRELPGVSLCGGRPGREKRLCPGSQAGLVLSEGTGRRRVWPLQGHFGGAGEDDSCCTQVRWRSVGSQFQQTHRVRTVDALRVWN